jgi:asparagine synthase (glutamine-hydrolysing)
MLGFASGKTDHPISSYTVGFSDRTVTDERPFARLAASRYGSEHHEMTIGPDEFASFLPKYVWHMEEPVCEPPAVALFYVSRLAREFVKVLISGEGGDEAFAGYSNYRSMLWLERLKEILRPFNGTLSRGATAVNRMLGSRKLAKYAPLLQLPLEEYYYSRTSSPFAFFNACKQQLYSRDFVQTVEQNPPMSLANGYLKTPGPKDPLSKMLYMDTKTWLPDDLLIKADKMTMANSVELRVPLLDHKLLEFAAALPPNFKVRGTTTKYIAKKVLNGRVPPEILNRKKAGFPVPYESWLRVDLKNWSHEILLDSSTLARGYFQRSTIENLLAKNTESANYSKEIFSLLVLELWHREFLDKEKVPLARESADPISFSMARN